MQIAKTSSFTGSNIRGGVRLLMHAFQESGVAGIVADGVEERIHADECHAEAVVVDRVLERFEGMVKIMNAKIVDPELVTRAGVGWGCEERTDLRAPIGLPSVLLIFGKQSSGVELR
jgi:hypothetical protein